MPAKRPPKVRHAKSVTEQARARAKAWLRKLLAQGQTAQTPAPPPKTSDRI
jgi:hypothetical protein